MTGGPGGDETAILSCGRIPKGLCFVVDGFDKVQLAVGGDVVDV